MCLCVCASAFTSADGSESWTLRSKAGAGDVVAMVTVNMATVLCVTCCPLGKRWRSFRREEGRRGRERDVRGALCSFSVFACVLVSLAPSLPAALLSGFHQFDKSFSSRPLAPPDGREQLLCLSLTKPQTLHAVISRFLENANEMH